MTAGGCRATGLGDHSSATLPYLVTRDDFLNAFAAPLD